MNRVFKSSVLSVWEDQLTVMRLFLSLVHPLLRASGKDKTMKRIPKTPVEFDYDLWTTEDGKCMVRVKATGETTEVDREVMKMLRNEEKKLRRSYDPSGSSASGDEEETQPSTILSLDAVPEDDVKSSGGWLMEKDFTDGVLTKLVIQDFRATLNSIHLAIFDQCLLGDKTIRAFAEEYGLRKSTVKDIANALRKNFKKIFCDSPDKRQKNVRCKVKGSNKTTFAEP